MRKFSLALSVLAAAIAAPVSAADNPIVVGQWYSFNFGGPGATFIQGFNGGAGTNPASINAPDPNWTFTLLTAGSITVLDAFLPGDQFQITDNGSIIGSTSAPNSAGASCGGNITACLADPNISQGTFALSAGSHSINGSVLQNAPGFTQGGGFFRINLAAVPEPSSWAMMLLGFGGIGLAMRRKRKVARLA